MAEDIRLDLRVETGKSSKNVGDVRKQVGALSKQVKSVDTKKITGSFKNFTGTVTKGLQSSTVTAGLFASGNIALQRVVGITTLAMQGFTTAMKFFKTATIGTNLVLKAFKFALIATGIGAIIVALGSLISFFTKTQRGVEIVNKAMAGLGAAIDVIIDRISLFGEAILLIFTDPLAAIDKMSEAFSGLGDEIAREATEAANLQGRLDQLIKSEREVGVQRARARKDIAELRLIAEERNRPLQERIEALDKVFKLEETVLAREVANAEERLAIIAKQVELGESLEEDLQKQADAEKALLNLQAQSFSQLRSITARKEALLREDLTARKAIAKEGEDLRKEEADKIKEEEEKEAEEKAERDKQIEDAEKQLKLEKAQAITDKKLQAEELAQIEFEEKLAAIIGESEIENELRLQLKTNFETRLAEIDAKFKEDQKASDDQAAADKLASEQALSEARISIARSITGSLASLGQILINNEEKSAKFAKAVAITELAINTAVAIAGAVRQAATNPANLAPPLLIADIAIRIGAILANIAKAKQLLSKASGPAAPALTVPTGGGGGAIGGGGGIPTGGPRLGAVGRTRLNPDGTIQEEQEIPPIKTFVVETEMTDAQRKIKRLKDNVTFE